MSNATKRTVLRCLHLILSIPVLGYIYGQPADVQPYAAAVRVLFVPAIILSGFWMYAGVVFAIVGVGLWLAAYRLSGYGVAVLSQAALFLGWKAWSMIRARSARVSGS